ncbi:transposase [Streptomyces microflavus]|uniref:transposase n=1 Tax=Streptomyces microflavus TaxID=1919 RepID=UPI0034287883
MPAPRKYPDELRERAIREVRATGRPIAHVAKDLGIHKEALRGWVRQAEADRDERDDRLTSADQDELRQLCKGNAELRAGERDPQGRIGVFCPADRPSPDEAQQVIDHLREKGLEVDLVCRVLKLRAQ